MGTFGQVGCTSCSMPSVPRTPRLCGKGWPQKGFSSLSHLPIGGSMDFQIQFSSFFAQFTGFFLVHKFLFFEHVLAEHSSLDVTKRYTAPSMADLQSAVDRAACE